jgi:hypothetical protein
MKQIFRTRKLLFGAVAAAGAALLLGAPYVVIAQKGRAVPGRIQTLTPYFLLTGEVTAVNGSLATVKTANYRPGPNTGVRSHAIAVGKSYVVDLSRALFQAIDGTPVTSQKLAVGDKVIMLLNATPNAPQSAANATVFNYTVHEVIRNDQTP